MRIVPTATVAVSLFVQTLLAQTAATTSPAPSPETTLRRSLQVKKGVVTLPGGVIEISREIVLPADADGLEIRGGQTTLKAAASFRGRALVVLPGGRNIRIHDLTLDGNRAAFPQPVAPTPAGSMLSRVVSNNGILAEGVIGLEISASRAIAIAGFPILINGGRDVHIHDVEISESGSLDASGQNNGSGGVALEEGVTDFEIVHALIGKVRGNGVWIRSASPSATASHGRIANSEFAIVARAGIELNHASGITIEDNVAHMIGFPGEEVLLGGTALPAAVATTGAVVRSVIRGNTFNQIAGRCMSLDGLDNSEVSGNECSEGLFNGLLVRGVGNRIAGNHLTGLNSARKDQPESLRTGIYLAGGSSANMIEANEISGYGMAQHCIGGPALAANNIAKNACSDAGSLALLQRATLR